MTLARFVEIVPKKPRVASRISSIVKPSSSGGGSIAFASGCFIATSGSAYVSFGFVFADQFCDGRGDGFAGVDVGGDGLATGGGVRTAVSVFFLAALASSFAGAALFFSLSDFFVEALQHVIRLRLDHGVEFGSGRFQLFEFGAVGFKPSGTRPSKSTVRSRALLFLSKAASFGFWMTRREPSSRSRRQAFSRPCSGA